MITDLFIPLYLSFLIYIVEPTTDGSKMDVVVIQYRAENIIKPAILLYCQLGIYYDGARPHMDNFNYILFRMECFSNKTDNKIISE